MSEKRPRILFLFAKHYPYGKLEKYLDHEMPYLAAAFDQIILVPFEYFDDKGHPETSSLLPGNVSVLDLNAIVKKAKPSARSVLMQAAGIWLYEFLHNPYRRFQLRHFRKNKNILLYQLLCSRVFEKELEKYRDADLYFYSYWFHHSALLLSALKSRKKIRHFISRAHSIDLYNENWLYADDVNKPLPFYHYKMKYTDRIVSISKHGESFLLERFPKYRKSIAQAYLGVKTNGAGVHLPASPFVIVSCSIFNDNKRVYLIPEILAKLGFPVRWVHFGEGGDNPDRVKKSFEKLPPNVEPVMKGFTPNAEILKYYAENPVHLFVNLSKAEGVPVAIMEAISFGIPVLATAVYGTVELGTPSSALFIPVDFSVDEAAEWIRHLAHDYELQAKMRDSARKHFEETVDASVAYRKFIDEQLLPFPNSF